MMASEEQHPETAPADEQEPDRLAEILAATAWDAESATVARVLKRLKATA